MESYYDRTVAVDPREEKLPRWAQDKLNAMRQLTTEAHSDLVEALLASDPEGSDAVLDPHGNTSLGTDGGRGLGKHALIRFQLGDGSEQSGIDCRLTSDRRWLQLRGEARLALVADASNSFRVRAVGHDGN